MKLQTNQLNFINLSMPLGSLSFVWFLQLQHNVLPCSLCLLQRWGMYLSLGAILLAICFSLAKCNKTVIALTIVSIFGNIFSLVMGLRNVWLQNLPADQIPACGLDIETLLEIVPFLEAVKKTFQGSGECADKAWVFLGQSLAVWASIFFTTYLMIQLYTIYKLMKSSNNSAIINKQ